MSVDKIVIYRTEDGMVNLRVSIDEDTVWLSINQIANLFDRDNSVIGKHIRNLYKEGELDENSTTANFAVVQNEGGRDITRTVTHYNLDVVISVGYRVKSLRGTQFRIWATKTLKEYMIKGFSMDDERLKENGGGSYFDELLERIRDIRSSEKVFWRKVLDIYATSIDYDPNSPESELFFKTVQNKMHWAVHGMTAAEKIFYSVDSSKPNMGLTCFKGDRPRLSDVDVAKNYCTPEEIKKLNNIVSAYLEFAELMASNGTPMTMRDWSESLDNFLKMTKSEILTNPGKISAAAAKKKAEAEYKKYNIWIENEPTQVDKDFLKAIEGRAGAIGKIGTPGRSEDKKSGSCKPKNNTTKNKRSEDEVGGDSE